MSRQLTSGSGDGSWGQIIVACVALLVCSGAVAGVAGAMTASSTTPDAAMNIDQNKGSPVDPNVEANVTASYGNSSGEKVTVSSASLPDGGYVAVYSVVEGDGFVTRHLIGSTDYVSPGTHEDVTIGLFDVPGLKYDEEKLDSSTYLVTQIHYDTNDNKEFDFAESGGAKDFAYLDDSQEVISDGEMLTVSGSDDENAESNSGDSDSDSDSDAPSDSSDSSSGDGSVDSSQDTTSDEGDDSASGEGSSESGSDSSSDDSSSASDSSDTESDGDGDSLEQRVANAGDGSSSDVEADTASDSDSDTDSGSDSDTSSDADSSDESEDADLTNNLRVRSTGDERTYYNFSVSGEIETGSQFDTTDAEVPDVQSGSMVSGSVAERGMDDLSYSGEITSINVSGDNANLVVNDEEVDPDDYPDEPTTDQLPSTSDESASDEGSSGDGDSLEERVANAGEGSSEDVETDSESDVETQQVDAQVDMEEDTGEGGSITFEDQETDGQSVTIESANLPSDGFVVLHGPGFSDAGLLEESAIAVSDPISGETDDLTLEVGQNIPASQYNESSLEGSGNYTAIAYRDTNTNGEFEYLNESGTDVPFTLGTGDSETLLMDEANVTVSGTRGDPDYDDNQEYATIDFPDQSTSGTSVTVNSTYLPDGGFVAIHNESYLPPTNDSLGSVIGVSRYLDPGNHTNVEVQLYDVPGRNYSESELSGTQTLTASAAQDINENETYNYLTSSGQYDVSYLDENGAVVDEQADVDVSESDSDSAFTTGPNASDDEETVGEFGNETITPRPEENASGDNVSVGGPTEPNQSVEIEGQQVATPTSSNQSAGQQQSGGAIGTLFSFLTVIVIIAVIAGCGVAYIVLKRR